MKVKILMYSIIGIIVISPGIYFIKKTIDKNRAEIFLLQSYQEKKNIKRERIVDTEKDIKKAAEYKERLESQGIDVPDSSKGYTTDEVAFHSSRTSCWAIVGKNVYDFTTFISIHPGGQDNILSTCGKDITASFNEQHGGQSDPETVLNNYKIGVVK